MGERLRWKLWGLLCRLPGVCPANAHGALLTSRPCHGRNPLIDRLCREGCADRGACWCGKLRRHDQEAGDE